MHCRAAERCLLVCLSSDSTAEGRCDAVVSAGRVKRHVSLLAAVPIRTQSAAEGGVACGIWHGCGFDANMRVCVLQGRCLPVTSYGLLLLPA